MWLYLARWKDRYMETVRVRTGRLEHNVLVSGPTDGPPVLLIHGNCSSATFWLPLLRHLPSSWRIMAPDLRGYGESAPAAVDATRGLADFADDIAEVRDAILGTGSRPVVVGHSMGAGVAMQLTIYAPDRVAALMLEAPISPYGFGGTRDERGTLCAPDHAGSGAGSVNPEFVRRITGNDRTDDEPASPRNVLRAFYVSDPASLGADEDMLVDSLLSTVVGVDNYPGDVVSSRSWPLVAPGARGVVNAMSPKYLNLSRLVDIAPKPPLTWIRGDADAIVSDHSMLDLANLGQLGVVRGWPGAEIAPPQPMIGQLRAVFDAYGPYTEIVFANCGHSPHVERPVEFAAALAKVVG
jgi:pimeloyl-ACP methyl ester carboxylesterase